jgi:L-fuculose-phosphate aldolase
VGADLFGAYYKMEIIEHFAKISLVARMLGRENVLSREEVTRLQALRGSYGIAAPAPICDPPGAAESGDRSDGVTCQIVRAPAGDGRRLILELTRDGALADRLDPSSPEADGEIRLTYRELSALIEDAIRSLR